MTWPRALRVDSEDAPGGWWGPIWPIGGVFLSMVNTNPSELVGFGTWKPLPSGLLLLGGSPAVVNSVTSAPSSVHVAAVPTITVYCWERTA